MLGCVGLTTLLLAALLVVNQWFLDDIARLLLARQQQRSGIAISAATIAGDLFSGTFSARDVVITRTGHPAGDIDLTVRSVDLTVAVWRVFDPVIPITAVTVAGVHGRYARGQADQDQPDQEQAGQEQASHQTLTTTVLSEIASDELAPPHRGFTIGILTLSDLDVVFTDHTRARPLVVPVTVDTLVVQPLRSHWAVFDALFRTTGSGTIAGSPFRLATSGDDRGRTTTWDCDGLPVAVLAAQLGGPFTLLTGGTCDVHVRDRWQSPAAGTVIDMDWSLTLNHTTAAVPAGLGGLRAVMAKPVAAFINAHGDHLPLAFTVTIDADRFDGTASAAAAGLWHAVADGLTTAIAKKLGMDPAELRDRSGRVFNAGKAVLERLRKKPTP